VPPLSRDAPPESIERELEENVWEFATALCRAGRQARLYQRDGVRAFVTGIPQASLNGLISPGCGGEALERGLDWLDASGLPYGAFVWRHGPVRAVERHYAARGFRPAGGDLGMAARLNGAPPQEAPAEVTVRAAATHDDLDAAAALLAPIYGWAEQGLAAVRELLNSLLPGGPGRLLLVRHRSALVSAGVTFAGSAVTGIYSVGTAPEARGRGYASAMVSAALAQAAADGYSHCVLHASAAGESLYRRFGFRPIAPVTVWRR
jgi:ribosomal protein S18 acetylase RimI-like enzyme